MQKYDSIPNIIFDFGGVLLNIAPQNAVKRFKTIGLEDTSIIEQEYQKDGFFNQFEKGIISPQDFRSKLRVHLKNEVTDQQINDAWNSMLLDLPHERLDLLRTLKKNHRLFLLSNTNIIHWEAYTNRIETEHKAPLASFFEKDYYSHNMGLRKPDAEIYTQVLQNEGLLASETLFIDDMLANVVAARSVGMKAHHLNLEKGENILDLFLNSAE